MTHNICFILLAVDKENNNDPLKILGLYLFVLAFPGECVNQLGSEVKSIPERSAGWFKTLDVWHRLMLCDMKKYFFIDMKFEINQAISQTITQFSCIQLETPSSRLWNVWWIKTYTTFKEPNRYCCLNNISLTKKLREVDIKNISQVCRYGAWLNEALMPPWAIHKCHSQLALRHGVTKAVAC